MKTLFIGALLLLSTLPLFAGTNNMALGGYMPFTIPANPTARQITTLFIETTEGIHDPFMVLRKIGSMGNSVVPALKTFLFDTPVIKEAVLSPDGKTVDSVTAPPPNKLYGVMALDLIGTPLAYQVLASVAQSDSDSQLRGAALNSLAQSYYYRARQDSLVPDKAVIGLLLQDLDDTTYIAQYGCRIGTIARRGLKNWTGKDYGQIPPESIKAKEEKRLGMTLTQYRLQQWQKNEANVSWDAKKGRFVSNP